MPAIVSIFPYIAKLVTYIFYFLHHAVMIDVVISTNIASAEHRIIYLSYTLAYKKLHMRIKSHSFVDSDHHVNWVVQRSLF